MLVGSEDVVKASIGSTEENSSWNRKVFIFRRESGGLLEVHIKK